GRASPGRGAPPWGAAPGPTSELPHRWWPRPGPRCRVRLRATEPDFRRTCDGHRPAARPLCLPRPASGLPPPLVPGLAMREGTNNVGRPLGGIPDMTYIGQHQRILELARQKSGVVEHDAEQISQVV